MAEQKAGSAKKDRSDYFPAIEKKHGQPMSYWFAVMNEISDRKYAEQIEYLRENHGFSQAHANALVMYSRGSTSSRRFETFDGYLSSLSAQQQETVQQIVESITKSFPELELVIAWNNPQFKQGSSYVFGLGAAKNHLLIAPWKTEVLIDFKDRLAEFQVNKKTIRIPNDWEVDDELLRDMVSACLAEDV